MSASNAPAPARNRRRVYATVPPQEILPIVDRNYESNVKGIHVIGDVTGLPLVKVAANQGVEVIERMEQGGAFRRDGEDDGRLDLVIVGAGPAGLSAAVEAAKRDLDYVLIERTAIANTVRSFPPGKKVYSEPRFLENRSELPVEGDRDRDDFLSAVNDAVQRRQLEIEIGIEVTRVRKTGERRFQVETDGGKSFPTRNVIIAVGRQGQPRKLDVPGEELEDKVTYRLHTPDDYRDKDVLVVGGGNSAIEAALMLGDTNRVTLSYRGSDFFRLKAENRRRLDQAIGEGRLTVLLESKVKEIRPDAVDVDVAGEGRTIPNHSVLILIGTLPPVEFLLDVGLELDGVWNRKRVFWSIVGIALGCSVYFGAKCFTLHPDNAGDNVTLIPGLSWMFKLIPTYFANLYGFYYLLYFSLIAFFGIYWAIRYRHRVVWRRNISNIVVQWTLWWGIPTFLAAMVGRNA